jgi:hypothetical protein
MKLSVYGATEPGPVQYGNVVGRQGAGAGERLCADLDRDHAQILRAMAAALARPFQPMTDLLVRWILVPLGLAVLLGCGEVRTTRESSTEDARRELEDGGWWPSEIPETATAIFETHDLDTNAQKIMFSLERGACQETAARMEPPSLSPLASVPALRLEGWPEWLAGVVDAGALSRRGAIIVPSRTGALVLVCEAGKGYFWR